MFKLLREIRSLLKEIRDELKKGNEPIRFEESSKRSFFGNDIAKRKEIQNRKSFADKIKHTKKDTRKITYEGIPYKNKNYIFDGWKNHIGEVINFEVCDDFLLLNLEGQILYALPRAQKYDELMEKDERLREKNERIEKELEPLREKANEAKKKQKEFLEKLDEIIKNAKERL